MLREAAAVIAILVLAGIAYLALAPVPVEPVAWQAPQAPGYGGPHARNTRLANLRQLAIGNEEGPEGMASGPDGKLYAAVASGAIVRLNAIVLSNLRGYPDNLTRGRDGRIWLGLVKPRGAAVDKLSAQPILRKVVMRLPKSLWPIPPAYGHVIAFDEAGKIVADLQDPGGTYPETTGVLETVDRLYIQSLHAKSLAWLPKAEAGLR